MIGLLIVVLLLCFLVIARHLRRNYGQVEKCGVPAVIPPTLLFGSGPWNLHQINHSELDMERAQKYGRVYGFYDMSTPWLSIADPAIVKKILVKNFESFPSHQFTTSDQKMRTLEQANGQEWKDLRKGLSPTFSSGKIKGMLDLLDGGVNQMITHLEEVTKKDSVVDIKDVFQKMTLDVIARCAFGIESNSFANPDNKMLGSGRNIFEEFILRDSFSTGIQHMFNALGSILESLIDILPSDYKSLWEIGHKICLERESRGAGGQGDFVDRLIELRKRHAEGELPSLSSEQIIGQAIIFILAGFETTASTLTSLSYFLAKNPDVLEKLIEEVDGVVEVSEGKIDQESIREMPYLEACIKETLRLLPPVFRTDRTCVKDWEEDGLFIPKGMNISVPVFAIHHDPSIWADPETFQPERFLKEQESSIQACSWLPFGGGPRQCIGERFAMVEMKIAMTKLLSKFNIEANEMTKLELRKGDQFLLSYDKMLVRIFARREE